MDKYNSKFVIVSLYLISAILAFTIIIEAFYITPSLAQTTGRYIEVSRFINIPKTGPNSTTLTNNTSNTSTTTEDATIVTADTGRDSGNY